MLTIEQRFSAALTKYGYAHSHTTWPSTGLARFYNGAETVQIDALAPDRRIQVKVRGEAWKDLAACDIYTRARYGSLLTDLQAESFFC